MNNGTEAKLRELIQTCPIIHWLSAVDEARYTAVVEEIKGLKGPDGFPEKIVLLISNMGGDLITSWAFYDFVRISGLHLVTVASGVVESAALFIFLTGKERYASKFSLFLIHDPTISVHQDISIRDVREIKRQICATHKKYLATMAHAMGLTERKIDIISKKGDIISVERAMELGIVHDIF